MPTKQGTDELVLIRKVGDRKDANKVMLVTELERETEKDRDTEATFDGSVNSGGTLESTVTINCYMDQKDTLCDEIEDATEDDTPYELWVINKRVRNEDGKYKAEYRQGYWNSITRTNEADGIAEFETEFGVYLKKYAVTLHCRQQLKKIKLLMASTILLRLIQQTMVWLKVFHNQQKLKLYKHEGNIPSFICANKK